MLGRGESVDGNFACRLFSNVDCNDILSDGGAISDVAKKAGNSRDVAVAFIALEKEGNLGDIRPVPVAVDKVACVSTDLAKEDSEAVGTVFVVKNHVEKGKSGG